MDSLVAQVAQLIVAIATLTGVILGYFVQRKIHTAVNTNHQAALDRIEGKDARIDRLEAQIVALTGKSSFTEGT
jgi:hypothetical protein